MCLGWVYLTAPVHVRNAGVCGRCGATRIHEAVLGFEFDTNAGRTNGVALFESVAGACGEHDWRNSSCHYASNGVVSCGRGDPTRPPIYEACARAELRGVEELVRRLATLDERAIQRLWNETVDPPYRALDSRDDARTWVNVVIQARGWQDLGIQGG